MNRFEPAPATSTANGQGRERLPNGVRTVGTIHEVGNTLRENGVHAVVAEIPPNIENKDLDSFTQVEKTIETRTIESYGLDYRGQLQAEKERIFKGLKGKRNERKLREVVERVVREIENEAGAFISQFPDHDVWSVSLDHTVSNGERYHQDKQALPRGSYRLVRTYVGPSTIYADDRSGTNAFIPKPGSLAVHDMDAWHRIPDGAEDTPRLTLKIDFAPRGSVRKMGKYDA